MSAKTAAGQAQELRRRMEEIQDASVDARVAYVDHSWRILQDMLAILDDRVARFGEKAFTLTTKQEALVEKILAEKQAALPAAPTALEPTKTEVAAMAAELGMGDYDPVMWYAARHVVKGEWTRFQAREAIADQKRERDQRKADREIFGTGYMGETNSNPMRIRHIDLQITILEALQS